MKNNGLTSFAYHGAANKRQQQGMTLIIAMIFLLILTLLGVTAMQGTVVEERIAGNTRDKDMAFQSAEDGLRAGEVFLSGNACTPGITFVAAPGAGLVNNVNGAAGAAFKYSSSTYWLAQPWNATDSRASTTALAGIVAPARYVIELVSGVSGLQAGAAGTTNTLVYRVTARGAGATAGSVSILQSTYTVICSFP